MHLKKLLWFETSDGYIGLQLFDACKFVYRILEFEHRADNRSCSNCSAGLCIEERLIIIY